MSFLSFDTKMRTVARLVANVSGVSADSVFVGIFDLWDAVADQQDNRIPDATLGGYFPAPERLRETLKSFGVLEPAGEGYWRVVGAERNIRTGAHPNSAIYFIQRGPDGPIKIGITAKVERRMSTLQTSNSERLSLMATMPGTVDDEAALHKRFASIRLTGEWFESEPELLKFIATLKSEVA